MSSYLRRHSRLIVVSLVIFSSVLLLHLPLLRLPYIWDEAGYYIPAARDLFFDGSLIPHSTVSNAHPPLVMAWVALWWKIFGATVLATRIAMLMVSSFALTGIFLLAEQIANRAVAIASTLCVACYSVFFTQSSLLHVDMAAAAFTFWGLRSYLSGRRVSAVIWFAAAGLAKETAVLAPLALAMWELLCPLLTRRQGFCFASSNLRKSLLLLASLLPLVLWFAYHYSRTGYVFGNPEFFRYNVAATLQPVRVLLAAGIRVWQMVGYLHLFLLSGAAAIAMCLPPQNDKGQERRRIDVRVQLAFLAVIVTYVAALSVIGGAELARYLLPVVPLGIIICISTIWRRLPYWKATIAVVAFAFITAWFVNPPYGFSFEDNLAYRDYILLHKNAAEFLESRYPGATVLTAWPASDELTHPYLGYVSRARRVVRIEHFAYTEVASASQLRSQFDVALIFSTKYFPPRSLMARWPAWERLQTRYFGFHRDLPPAAAAQVLGGRLVYTDVRNGQWTAVIELERAVDARRPNRLRQSSSDKSGF